jgi:hypothetical protein
VGRLPGIHCRAARRAYVERLRKCPCMGQESGIRNSRRDSTQEWAMSGQVQELQVPGTPEGGTLARVLARTLPYTGQYFSTPEKNSARTGMGPKNAPCLAPTTHATSGNSSTRSSRMKRGSGDRNAFAVAKCTGTSRRPRSSSTSASSLHARLQQSSNRERELRKTSTRTSKLQCGASMPRSSRRSLP